MEEITAVASPIASEVNNLAARLQYTNPNNAMTAELIIKYNEFLNNESFQSLFIITNPLLVIF
jgi:hypothetical protein